MVGTRNAAGEVFVATKKHSPARPGECFMFDYYERFLDFFAALRFFGAAFLAFFFAAIILLF